MENVRISLQYSPSFLQNMVTLESMEENKPTSDVESDEALEPEPETVSTSEEEAPEETSEAVYFHLTPPAIESLAGVLIWSKILVVCTSVFLLMQLLALIGVFLQLHESRFSFNDATVLISIGITCWTYWQAVQFNRNMGQALKHNDNLALAEAFGFQAQFFKWGFLNILITIGLGVLAILF